MTVVVALSAERSAGKTTLARVAAVALDAVHASVSGWLAHRLAEDRVPLTPDALRAYGECAAQDPVALVAAVLTYHGWRPGGALVFDAIRHREALEALREHVRPQPVLHVALVLASEHLADRLAERGDAIEVIAGAGHSTERQVPELIASADLALEALRPVEELALQICEACQALR